MTSPQDAVIAQFQERIAVAERVAANGRASYVSVQLPFQLAEDILATLLRGPLEPWQPIETCPREETLWFWVRPKTAEESYCDTSGNSIVTGGEPHVWQGKYKCWSALQTADWWMRVPWPNPPVAALLRGRSEPQLHEKTNENAESRGDDSQYGAPLATAAENQTAPAGVRYCAHGQTPLGDWCRQCNPLRQG